MLGLADTGVGCKRHYTYHIVNSNFLELATNLVFQEIIGTKGVDVHVSTHRDELGTGKVIKGNVIMEEFGNSNDIRLIGGLSSGSNLQPLKFQPRTHVVVKGKARTFRKNSLNSSLRTTLSALSPDSLTVSCKNLAISIRTRNSFLCFSF